ncbi:MAG: amylo-alpha-1,6-glucosidase [Actinomycetota bacterium]
MAEKPAPAAVDIRDVQVIKEDRTFIVSDKFGDMPEGNTAALGLYHDDTRFLSRFEVAVNDLKPLLLHSSTERNYSQNVELAYPMSMMDPSGFERKENLSLHRYRVLGGSMFERLRVHNFGRKPLSARVTLDFDADFRDLFEVRGLAREQRGQMQPAKVEHNQVVLSYRGLDGETRSTTLRFSPAPDELTESHAEFIVQAQPGVEVELAIEITPAVGRDTPDRLPMGQAEDRLGRDYTNWRKQCTRFRTSHPQLSEFLDRAILDIRMLISSGENGTHYIDAGIPWYSTLFGRDSLITAYQAITVNPDLAWGTLRGLAALQGKEENEWREEEPGKILHEVRLGELARCNEIPHTPYYGSIDSTPLWLILLSSAYSWTADLDSVKELWPNALAALEWIDTYGDLDGDGYLEYQKRSARGLDNQGWKDSFDAVLYEDGTRAKPPIALVEVQGYAYQAKLGMARLAEELGEIDLAQRLQQQAADLKERFNRDFWVEETNYFALALDGDKKPVPTISSNPGHCLWSEIVDEEKAPRVAHRLLSPRLSSGWGIRTLADKQPAFDPLGYHTGSIWPHDNSLIIHGLKRYGFDTEAQRVMDQLALAGSFFPLGRFPELFCGYSAEEVPVPVQYPVACRPQAWASGAPLLMVRSYAGLTADAPEKRLYVVRPRLPIWLSSVEILGMRVGDARIDITFTNHDGVTATQIPRKEGDLEVLIRQ